MGDRAWLPDAFGGLPEQQRIVLALLYGYQWSMAEAADHLGVSEATAPPSGDTADRIAWGLAGRLDPADPLVGMPQFEELTIAVDSDGRVAAPVP